MSKMTLYGFDGSTYVRTVKMIFAAKNFTDFDQVQVNVLEGEPRKPEHLERHPFGKVPVLDHDGFRILETIAVARYVNDVIDGPSFVPDNAKDRARMDMSVSIVDSYGYGALIGGVTAYHLFPHFVGGKNDEAHAKGIEDSRKVLNLLMKTKGDDPYIAGGNLSLADLYLGPICFYVSLTPDADQVFDVPGFSGWWDRMKAEDIFKKTEPDLG